MKSLYTKSATLFVIFLMLTMRIVQAQAVPVMHFECGVESVEVCYLAWHPKNDWVAMRTGYADVRVVDISTLERKGDLFYEGSHIILWNPDGTLLTTVGVNGILIRDPAEGEIIHQVDPYSWLYEQYEEGNISSSYNIAKVESMAWNPDGSQLAFISGGYVCIWNISSNTLDLVNTPKDRSWDRDEPIAVDWSPDGNTLALSTDAQFALIDANTYTVNLRIDFPPRRSAYGIVYAHPLAWSPDGEWVAVAVNGSYYRNYDHPAQVLLFDPDSGAFEHTLETEAKFVRSVAWSPDSRWLAATAASYVDPQGYDTAYYDNSVRVWDVERVKLVKFLPFDTPVFMVEWSTNGDYIATSTYNGSVDIWENDLD